MPLCLFRARGLESLERARAHLRIYFTPQEIFFALMLACASLAHGMACLLHDGANRHNGNANASANATTQHHTIETTPSCRRAVVPSCRRTERRARERARRLALPLATICHRHQDRRRRRPAKSAGGHDLELDSGSTLGTYSRNYCYWKRRHIHTSTQEAQCAGA